MKCSDFRFHNLNMHSHMSKRLLVFLDLLKDSDSLYVTLVEDTSIIHLLNTYFLSGTVLGLQ